ncbi:Hypothetical predicted protein [Paramuricea clavata]|uniref:Uncharacterized protein n=1 Tax=Paramuricea clavata TaxID=317549 RepID=A0A6S7HXY5_PARCT|nr:Hypothetical predicted protein [Paramuricea clavata]
MVRGLVSEGGAVDLPMTSETITVMSVNEVEDVVILSAERIVGKIESYWKRDSSFIELLAPLRSDKNGLINIENRDDIECFRWCHVRHLVPKNQKANKITRPDRKFAETLDYKGVSFPVKIDDIPKIEKANKIRITVIMLKGEKMFFPSPKCVLPKLSKWYFRRRISCGKNEDAMKFACKFDTSGYSKDSPFYDATNKKVIWKMKDEAGGVPIREFIGLRSKMYSYEKEDGKGCRRLYLSL